VIVLASYDESDFERAVATVSAESSPNLLAERLGIEWDYLGWLALGVAEEVLREEEPDTAGEPDGTVVAFCAEAFTAGFLIGSFLPPAAVPRGRLLPLAVDNVQQRGRHAVIADHCDLSSVARLETMYSAALVESLPAREEDDRNALRQPVTRIFESGLATGLALSSL
jgi:hypothetical protein